MVNSFERIYDAKYVFHELMLHFGNKIVAAQYA